MDLSGHRQVEHTADMAVELWAPTEAELLREGARALAGILTEGQSYEATESRSIELESIDSEDRLVQWLNEVLYLATVEGLLTVDAEIELLPGGLRATIAGTRPDTLAAEIKSATYHDLEVRTENGRWSARVVLDV